VPGIPTFPYITYVFVRISGPQPHERARTTKCPNIRGVTVAEAPSTSTDPINRRPIDLAWASLAAFVPAIVVLLSRMDTIDLAYHLRAGNMILGSHTIPRVDTFTFTAAGAPWIDQQWGAQVILASSMKAGGWPTLAALQAILVAVTFLFVYLACRASGASVRLCSVLALGGFFIASPALAMRPQLLAIALFAMALWAVASRDRHQSRLWIVPLAAAACANIHGSFPLFPLLPGMAWLEDLHRKDPRAGKALAVTVATIAATFLNPFGPRVWSYVASLSTDPVIRRTITEWAPTTLAHVSGWLMLGSGLGVAWYFARRTTVVPWPALLWLAIFFVLAMAAQRAIVWWALVAPVILSQIAVPSPRSAIRHDPALAEKTEARSPAVALLVVMVLCLVVLAPWWRGSDVDRYVISPTPGLTSAIQGLPGGTRLLADQPWASWFEYATPEAKVFVDSRIEVFSADVWHDYGQVAYAGAGWSDVLKHWDVQAIAASKEGDTTWQLIPTLLEDPDWRIAYEDPEGILFVRS